MKKIILIVIMVALGCTSRGQVAKWIIPPLYDSIRMANVEELIITDSVDKRIIWSQSGKRLASTIDVLFPFYENLAITTKKDSATITGFYNKEGKFTALNECNVSYSFPYFSDGYLLVKQGFYYKYINSKGETKDGLYVNAYPFSNGYASCSTYRNIQKKKDLYNLLISKEEEQIAFFFEGKQFDDDDIEFVSSVNDENIGIVIAKHKLFYFNGKDRSLLPIYATKGENNRKNQAKLEGELALCLVYDTDSTSVLQAKCGKSDWIQIRFDNLRIPLSISFANGIHIFKKDTIQKRFYESPLRMVKKENKYGIFSGGEEILPPQLDTIISCFNDKAFVRLSNKCGMLQIFNDDAFKISINKDNPIDFRHQKYETTIRLDLPKIISSYNTRVDIDPSSGCEVDLPSGEKKDTEFGNYIQYNCVLNIPNSLPDEMYGDYRNEITYPTQIIYDGLKSPVIPVKVQAWHYKYFNVDINDAETSIHQGVLSFTFNINAERNPGEAVYPTSINIQTDSLQFELEKISETRYKCKVIDLNEGNNNIIVQILEQGCPPASFPFDVTYTKPSARTKNQPATKEDVVIKKKTKKTQTSSSPTPHLDI